MRRMAAGDTPDHLQQHVLLPIDTYKQIERQRGETADRDKRPVAPHIGGKRQTVRYWRRRRREAFEGGGDPVERVNHRAVMTAPPPCDKV